MLITVSQVYFEKYLLKIIRIAVQILRKSYLRRIFKNRLTSKVKIINLFLS